MDGNNLLDVVRIVSTQAALDTAYAELKDGLGGTILLDATQSYTLKSYDARGQEDAPVTIRSLNPEDPAILNRVRLNGAENLTFEEVHFHLEDVHDTFDDTIIRIGNSQDILIRNCLGTSDATGPRGTVDGHEKAAIMAVVRGSTGVTFEGNTLHNLNHGVAFMDCYDGAMLDNDISGLQGDAIRIGGVTGMRVEGNHLHDMLGATWAVNHADMIQLWGENIKVNNADITIRENFLDAGNGAVYHMIFGHNNSAADNIEDNGFVFSNILIEGNVLFGGHANSIALRQTDRVTVRNNTVIHNTDSYEVTAEGDHVDRDLLTRIRIEGTNALVENNIAENVLNEGPNTELALGSLSSQNDYRTHFINVEAAGSGDLRDLMLRPDSPLNGEMGSWLTWSSDTAETLTAVADVTVAPQDLSLVTLDASLSRGPAGYVAQEGAEFTWLFDDGRVASGATVTHDFETAGCHGYELIVTLPDGTTDQISRTITIDSPVVANIGTQGMQVLNCMPSAGSVALHEGLKVADGWIEIGGHDRLEICRDNSGLYNLSHFNIGVTVDVAPDSSGILFQLLKTLDARVLQNGHLEVSLTTTEGSFTLESATALFADEGSHRLNLLYDNTAQTLSLVVDDVVDASVTAHGITPPIKYWGLTFGAAWQQGVTAAIRDIYVLNETSTLAQAMAATCEQLAPIADTAEAWGALCAQSAEEGVATLDFTLGNGGVLTQDGFDICQGVLNLTRANSVFFDSDAFEIRFDMTLADALEGAANQGTVLYLHKTLSLELDAFDRLVFRLTTNEGAKQIATSALDFEAGEAREITIAYDGDVGEMQIRVDGDVMARGIQTGLTGSVDKWNMHFGHPWDGDSVDMVVNNIFVFDEVQRALPQVEALDTPDMGSGDMLLALDFDGTDAMDASGAGAEVTRVGPEARLVVDSDGEDGQILQLGDRSGLRVTRDYDGLHALDNFAFNFDMRSDAPDGRSVFSIPRAYRLDVHDDDLRFRFATTDGEFRLETSGNLLSDRDWHNVNIAYCNDLELLQMKVDGTLVAETQASGTSLDKAFWGLNIGFVWGDGFNGAIDDFTLLTNIGADHFELG